MDEDMMAKNMRTLIKELGNERTEVYALSTFVSIVAGCKTVEDFEKVEKAIDECSVALRKERIDKTTFIRIQIIVALILRDIAVMKDELAPKRDLLLDGKPKPPNKGGGAYRTMRRVRYE